MKRTTINEINRKIENEPEKFIRECEDDFNKRVLSVVEYIKENEIKYVFVSGPTSSGKTTFSKRFEKYLSEADHIDISLDDYYKTLDVMPLKKDNDYNFESVNSLRLDEIKKDFTKLKNKEEVAIPLVDFQTGKRVEENSKIKINNDTVVVIEGLHANNSKICDIFKAEKCVKIFICPTPNIEYKKDLMSGNDLRFIRRMVRDNNYRNSDAANSMRMWKTVRESEKIYMKKYRENADFVINTFLPYEPCILKEEAMELLNTINPDSVYIRRAKRLKNILSEFRMVNRKYVPRNSLLNEFIKKD